MSIPEHFPFSNLVGLDVFINYVRTNWVGKRLCNGDWKDGRYNSELWITVELMYLALRFPLASSYTIWDVLLLFKKELE
uniref:Uncharacterized protein n=1 Tax=Ditylenchus dipsaci TaxID=166011 RepID=A0A915EMP6_9BILA